MAKDVKPKSALPTREWMEAMLDRKLKQIVEDLEAGEKVTPTDFERLLRYYKAHHDHPEEIPEIVWVDDWDDVEPEGGDDDEDEDLAA